MELAERKGEFMHPLDRLFKPKSIAVVGASTDESKAGYQMMYALRSFPGELYPINPKADSILGFKASASLEAIGKPVDLVVLTIPAAGCADILQQAGQTGAGAALIIGGGFAETGESGRAIQQEILAICHKYDIKLLGPNTAGFATPSAGVCANFNPWIGEVAAGPIGLISQSGAMSLVLSALIHTQNLGVSLATGVGNSAVVGVADVVEYLTDDTDTKVIILYLEGIKDGRRLYDAVRNAVKKKPVLFLTVGQANIGEFAVSHTGNLIGSFKMKTSALKQAGAIMIDSSDDLIDAANLLSRTRLEPKENPGVGFLTGQAGPGMVITDYLRSKGVLIPELNPATVEKIRQALPPLTYIKNPVDTGRPGPGFPSVLEAIAADSAIDLLLTYIIDEPAVIEPITLFKGLSDIRQPIIMGTSGFEENIHPVQKALSAMNIASFASPDRAAKAVCALVNDAKSAYRLSRSEEAAAELPKFERLNQTPSEAEAKDILQRIGIPTPRRAVCRTHEEAKEAFGSLSRPCVLKILDPGISHKTEVGGVILNIKTERQLTSALRRIDRIKVENERRYLVEEMAKDGLELIIGATNDASFGSTVLVGLGGITAEAIKDTAMRLAPLGFNEAMDMISGLRGRSLFDGWRGSPPLDKVSVARALVALGEFMLSHPEVKEVDLNPVRVYETGLLALDALFVL
jgi:acetate---CoA ligase (ADP-forming)